jgi:hypothetical protein
LAEPEKETEPTNQTQTQVSDKPNEAVKAIEQPTNLDQSEAVQKFREKYGTPTNPK